MFQNVVPCFIKGGLIMTIITGSRASGKTYNLLNIASAQNIPILVGSEDRRIALSEYAKKLGIKVDIINVRAVTCR